MTQNTYRFDAVVGANGKLDISVPCPIGTKVAVMVMECHDDDCSDLLAASSTSLDFWDNEWDDEDWNNA